ncbi:MAG: DoxX family protein [Burkholderiales bacterium]|jgi:putative oxidoreductase|nr:DoxX family protein [Burkholderiales bacterium]MBP8054108.1 DoxX family protein [Burkholderiaceae bacterium]
MNSNTSTTGSSAPVANGLLPGLIRQFIQLAGRIPNTVLAFVARFSIAAVFWKSGQTKIQGFALDIVNGEFSLGWPHLSDSVVDLFRDEYRLPLISPEAAATLAAFAEHLLPILLLLGIATRLSALGLFGMTLTIQFLVYPDAYPAHGTWMAVLLYLMVHGPGKLSVDHWIARRFL